jgi:hypothetical protein
MRRPRKRVLIQFPKLNKYVLVLLCTIFLCLSCGLFLETGTDGHEALKTLLLSGTQPIETVRLNQNYRSLYYIVFFFIIDRFEIFLYIFFNFRNIVDCLAHSFTNAKIIVAEKSIISELGGVRYGATADLIIEHEGLKLLLWFYSSTLRINHYY